MKAPDTRRIPQNRQPPTSGELSLREFLEDGIDADPIRSRFEAVAKQAEVGDPEAVRRLRNVELALEGYGTRPRETAEQQAVAVGIMAEAFEGLRTPSDLARLLLRLGAVDGVFYSDKVEADLCTEAAIGRLRSPRWGAMRALAWLTLRVGAFGWPPMSAQEIDSDVTTAARSGSRRSSLLERATRRFAEVVPTERKRRAVSRRSGG